jgi:hypothetical protein
MQADAARVFEQLIVGRLLPDHQMPEKSREKRRTKTWAFAFFEWRGPATLVTCDLGPGARSGYLARTVRAVREGGGVGLSM